MPKRFYYSHRNCDLDVGIKMDLEEVGRKFMNMVINP